MARNGFSSPLHPYQIISWALTGFIFLVMLILFSPLIEDNGGWAGLWCFYIITQIMVVI